MGRRVCGASVERDRLSASRCWCRGLFCGRGGFRETQRFQRQFRRTAPAFSRAEFEELVAQADLLDGDRLREIWIGRLDVLVPAKRTRGRRCPTTDDQASSGQ